MKILPESPNRAKDVKGMAFLPDAIGAKGKVGGDTFLVRRAIPGEWSQEDEFHSQRLKLIGRMVAKIAHEVKNPVASMQLNIELIESELEHIPNEQSRQETFELLGSVKRELERLEAITRAYLQYVTIPRLEVRKNSVHRMLKELQKFLRKEMESRKVRFVNDFSTNVPNIFFDEDRLREAVLNLYKNAADAMPDGGRIETSTHIFNDWLEIRVSDTGAGIPDVYAEKLFDAFFSSKSRGTGLGLTISRDILIAHGGTITLGLREAGETTFILRLPIGG